MKRCKARMGKLRCQRELYHDGRHEHSSARGSAVWRLRKKTRRVMSWKVER